jgi:hypothetical protein
MELLENNDRKNLRIINSTWYPPSAKKYGLDDHFEKRIQG